MFVPRLGLSDAQKEQIKTIVQAHTAETQPLETRAAGARQALQDAIMTGTVDESLIRQRSAELAAAQADLDVVHARIFAEVFQLLTPDQQAQVRDMQAKVRERMKAGPAGRGRGPGGFGPKGGN
jgi:Spy/CpxP family protein refolding chaperone